MHILEVYFKVALQVFLNIMNNIYTLLLCSKLKTITSFCLTGDAEQLLLGTEGGNIHVFNIYSFQLTEQVLYQDTVTQK